MKALVQCDFDGTITEEDVSFLLLDAFAQGNWRQLLEQYKEHQISVWQLNTRAFAMVKADRSALLEALKGRVRIRAGFRELVDYCARRGFRLVIVSNGLDFYIEHILKELGLRDIEMHAAQAFFHPEGMRIQYVGPDGSKLEEGFKEAYAGSFAKLGYGVTYIGNGESDVAPARYAQRLFATGELLAYCKKNGLKHKPFETFFDVIRELNLENPCPQFWHASRQT